MYIKKLLKIPAMILLVIVTIFSLIANFGSILIKIAVGAMMLFSGLFIIVAIFANMGDKIGALVWWLMAIVAGAIVLSIISLLLKGVLADLQKNLLIFIFEKPQNEEVIIYDDTITPSYVKRDFKTYESELHELQNLLEMGNISKQDFDEKKLILDNNYDK